MTFPINASLGIMAFCNRAEEHGCLQFVRFFDVSDKKTCASFGAPN